MSKAYEFLKECGVFYVATVNGSKPAVRPFGALMEYKGKMYICTGNFKEVYKQMKANPAVQLSSTKPKSHDWIRVNAVAVEDTDIAAKEAMLAACPALVNLFKSADNPVFAVFALTEVNGFIFKDGKNEEF